MATRSHVDTTMSPESSAPGDIPCGAVWRKVDLHLHSPGVDSFRCPNGADLQTEAGRQRIVEAYMRQMQMPRSTSGRSLTTTAFVQSGLSRSVTRHALTVSPYSHE
jgi:hypothetical protein